MTTRPESVPPYLVTLFPVLFVLFWLFISEVISFLSGWHALARRFTKQSEPCGEITTAGPFFYVVHMRYWSHYSSVIRVSAAEDALYLSVLFPYRFGHPPLRVPWSEIEFDLIKLYWRGYVVLTLGREEQIPFRISERMARI